MLQEFAVADSAMGKRQRMFFVFRIACQAVGEKETTLEKR